MRPVPLFRYTMLVLPLALTTAPPIWAAATAKAPSDLTATASGNTIVLHWHDNSDREQGFVVERRSGEEGRWRPLRALGADVTHYTDRRLGAATYYYRVKALLRSGGFSSPSNEAGATTGPIAAPTDLTATAPSAQRVSLTWHDASSNETGFLIERGSSGAWVPLATVAAGTGAFDDDTVAPATTYDYRVSAVALGERSSPPSNIAAVTTPEAGTTGNDDPIAKTILFVTQVPMVQFQSVTAAFGAHQGGIKEAPRGGDLWIRYPDGTLRNLTKEAGFGVDGPQDGSAPIAVRQPTVHWDGTRALFSMVTGAPSHWQVGTWRWQLYQVTGLQPGQTAAITKVPCQPAEYNNIAPAYGSDGQIFFVSDRPRNGAAHLYPQRDEYESVPTDTGIWQLDPLACRYDILEHAPSGVTYPSLDSFGRVVFTKWDHLLRDQQADADRFGHGGYGAFNYASEEATSAPPVHSVDEHFPELRRAIYSLEPGNGYDGTAIAADYPFNDMNFNHFFPWVMNQDGSEEQTLNHAGRHELGGSYGNPSYRDDPGLEYITYGEFSGGDHFLYGSGGLFHLREDPTQPGRFWGVSAPEFATATGGDLVYLDGGAPGMQAEQMRLTLVADKDTFGRLRNPLPLSDGRLLVVHTAATGDLSNLGTSTAPNPNYAFRLRELKRDTAGATLGDYLTPGIEECLAWWDPDQRVEWCGTLWELDPVEVTVRPVPPRTAKPALPAPEQQILAAAGVDETLLERWLEDRGLALMVSRNLTTRDRTDQSQPNNLTVAGGEATTLGKPGGKVYTLSHLQLFQADQIRGYSGATLPTQGGTPNPGRRPLAVPLHDSAAVAAMGAHLDPAIPGAVPLGPDGSSAAFVPAGRAMTWQTIDAEETGWRQAVVRERNWISFRPGERRVCTSCHGLNTADQAGNPKPQNPPQALASLLGEWKKVVRNDCPASGGTGVWSYTSGTWSPCRDGEQHRIQTCQGGNGCCDGMPASEARSCSGQ